jgi:3-hydroxyacyl-CoA dehydrogenase
MTSGKVITAQEALNIGLIDNIIDIVMPPSGPNSELFLELAEAYALSPHIQSSSISEKRISSRSVKPHLQATEQALENMVSSSVSHSLKGFTAPKVISQAVLTALKSSSFEEGLKIETLLYQNLLKSSQTKALQYIHFAEERCKAMPTSTDDESGNNVQPINAVGVLGGGTMGTGISIALLDANISVILVDTDAKRIEEAKCRIETVYKRSSAYKSGKLNDVDIAKKLENIIFTTDMKNLKTAELVIEAIYENMETKKTIFRELDAICSSKTILASNTSTLSIDALAAETTRPQNVIGTR